MRTKKIVYSGFAVLIVSLIVSGFAVRKSETAREQQAVGAAAKGIFPILRMLSSRGHAAEEEGDASCNVGEAAWAKVQEANAEYEHGALKYFNSMFRMLNNGFPSEVESALCHFAKSMGMDPDLSALPVTIEKTFGSQTVALTVAVPTEAFATAAGYVAKGTVTIDGDNFMVLYWGGEAESTKGFMIRGAKPMGDGHSGGKGVMYISWDRTDSAAQFVKFWGAKFATSYLGSSSGSDEMQKDRSMYGYASYNATTKAVTTYAVSVEPQRVGSGFGCYRMWAQGLKGGAMTIAKTDNAHNNAGHAVSATFLDGTEMDAAQLDDLEDTANGTGNLSNGDFSTIVVPLIAATPFGKSCSDLNGGAGSGQPFEGGDADFAAAPDDVF